MMLREDHTALEVLYDRYAGLALGLATQILHDRQSAEDAVQEGFLQAWRRAATYDPAKGSLRSWIIAIVRHRCLDVLRRQVARPQIAAQEQDILDRPGPTDTWASVDRRLTQASIRGALLRLAPEQRRVIELGYFGGYSQSEIAEMLGIPLGTVKGRFRLGLHRLRTLLNGLEEVPA